MDKLKQKIYEDAKNGRSTAIESTLKDKSTKEINQILNHVTVSGEEEFTPLLIASRNCHVKVVDLLLNMYGVYPDQTGSVNIQGQIYKCVTSLWITGDTQNMDIAKLLLKSGANINHSTSTLSFPLRVATYHSNLEMVELFIKHGADVNLENKHGATALHNLGGIKGNVSVTRALLKAGANPNSRMKDERNILHSCANHGTPEDTKEVLKYGAILQVTDKENTTPLQEACMREKEEIVQVMLNNKDISITEKIEGLELLGAALVLKDKEKGYSYMLLGMKERETKGIKKDIFPSKELYDNRQESRSTAELTKLKGNHYLLLLEGLMVSERILSEMNCYRPFTLRYTATILADEQKSLEGLLFAKKALEITQENRCNSSDCLELVIAFLVEIIFSDQPLAFDYLLSVFKSCNTEIVECAKLQAAERNDGSDLERLVALAVQVIGLSCKFKATAAEKVQFVKEVKTLIQVKSKFKGGKTPLHIACLQETYQSTYETSHFLKFPNIDTVKILMECGAKPNIQDDDGNTPMHIIVQYVKATNEVTKLKDIVAVFIDAGADMNLKNKEGNNPLNVAAKSINKAIETGQLEPRLKGLVDKIAAQKL